MSNIKKLHPGIYIKNAIETMGMTSKEFSIKTGVPEKILLQLLMKNVI